MAMRLRFYIRPMRFLHTALQFPHLNGVGGGKCEREEEGERAVDEKYGNYENMKYMKSRNSKSSEDSMFLCCF